MEDDTDRKKTKSYRQPVPPTGRLSAEGNQAETPAIKEQRKGPEKDTDVPRRSWEKPVAIITLLFDVLLFSATVAYVIVSARQLHSMKRTLRQVRRQADITEKQLVYSERPWLAPGIIGITQPPASHQIMKLDLPFQNSGKSPALHAFPHAVLKPVTSFFEVKEFVVPFTDDPAIAACYQRMPEWDDNSGGEMVLPGSIGLVAHLASQEFSDDDLVQLMPASPSPQATPSPAASVPTASPTIEPIPQFGKLKLFLVGCAIYFDEFHVPHRTQFCQFYVPGPPSYFAFCPKGNSAD